MSSHLLAAGLAEHDHLRRSRRPVEPRAGEVIAGIFLKHDMEVGAAEPKRRHARVFVFRYRGLVAKSTRVVGLSMPRVAGRTRCFSARAALMTLAKPANVFVWPIIDLTEPTATLWRSGVCAAKT